MPGHSDEEWTIMPVVGRPPRLAVGHQCGEVALYSLIVEFEERFRIVEVVAVGVAAGTVLRQNLERELVGPPVAVGPSQQCAQCRRLLPWAAVQRITRLGVHVLKPS